MSVTQNQAVSNLIPPRDSSAAPVSRTGPLTRLLQPSPRPPGWPGGKVLGFLVAPGPRHAQGRGLERRLRGRRGLGTCGSPQAQAPARTARAAPARSRHQRAGDRQPENIPRRVQGRLGPFKREKPGRNPADARLSSALPLVCFLRRKYKRVRRTRGSRGGDGTSREPLPHIWTLGGTDAHGLSTCHGTEKCSATRFVNVNGGSSDDEEELDGAAREGTAPRVTFVGWPGRPGLVEEVKSLYPWDRASGPPPWFCGRTWLSCGSARGSAWG